MKLKQTFQGLLISSVIMMGIQGCASSDEELAGLPAPLPELVEPKSVNILWQHQIADGVEDYYSNLAPTIAYDKVFTASRGGDVYAFDLESGKKLWHSDVRLEANGFWQIFWFDDDRTARVAGGLVSAYQSVYMGTEDGEVIALAEDSGDLLWRTSLPGEILASPAVDGGHVFIQTTSGKVYALEAKTGEITWQSEAEVPPLTLRGTSAPIFANGGVLVGGANGKLSAYLAETGQLAWEESIAKPSGTTELARVVDIDTSPIVIGPLIYSLSYGGTLTALEYRSGRVVWKREYAGFVDMTHSGNELILVDLDSNIYAIDRRNGVEKWSSSELIRRGLTAPALHAGLIAVGDFEGYMHWLEADSGKIVAQMLVDSDGLYSQAKVSGTKLISQGRSGELLAVELP